MDRRAFGRVLLGVAAAAATVTVLAPQVAEAAVMPVVTPEMPTLEADRVESDFRPDVDALPKAETVQWGRRRRRRGFGRRRRIFGRRRRRW
jgi:hypothetical protein